MPIYEYYCANCNGQFSHLAKRVGASAPPCPRCGNTAVERLVSSASLIHSRAHHEGELRQASRQVDANDYQAAARFLKESGRLEDAEGVYGSKVYRELIARRAEGAAEPDVADLVDDLVVKMQESDASKMAGAVMFSERVENRMSAEGPPEEHDSEDATARDVEQKSTLPGSRQKRDNLGWA